MTGNNPRHFVFSGHSRHTIDPKCRLSIPSDFRSRLPPDSSGKFFINVGRERRLEIHPEAEWNEVQMPKLSLLNDDNRKQRMKLRARLTYCFEVDMDTAFRLLVPRPLLEYIDLGPGGSCVISSLGGYLEVMNAKAFDMQMKEVLDDPSRFTDDDWAPSEPDKQPDAAGKATNGAG